MSEVEFHSTSDFDFVFALNKMTEVVLLSAVTDKTDIWISVIRIHSLKCMAIV